MTLPEKTPLEIEARGLRRRFRHSTRYGPMYFIEVEVQKNLWDAVEGVPDAALIGGVMYWHTGDPDGTEQPRTESQVAGTKSQVLSTESPDPFDGVAEAYPDDDGPARPLPLPPKEPPTKGEWGMYWKELWARGFQHNPDLLKELHVNGMGDSVAVAIRNRFKEDSRTKIRPDRLEAWLVEKRLHNALAIAQDALERVGGLEYKWGKKDKVEAA